MISDKSVPAYDLRRVNIDGTIVEARPIQWNGKIYDGQGNDADGNPVKATMYMTTCPKCGQMIQFKDTEILETGNGDLVGCSNCGAGKVETVEAVKEKIAAAYEDPKKQPEKQPEKQPLKEVVVPIPAQIKKEPKAVVTEPKVVAAKPAKPMATTPQLDMGVEPKTPPKATPAKPKAAKPAFKDPIESGKMKIE